MIHEVIYWPNEEQAVEASGLLSLPEYALHLLATSACVIFFYQLNAVVVFKPGLPSFLVFVYQHPSPGG